MSIECPGCGYTSFSCEVLLEHELVVDTFTDPYAESLDNVADAYLRNSTWTCMGCCRELDDTDKVEGLLTRALDETLRPMPERPIQDTAPL